MSEGGGELVATDESAIITESLLYAIVVEGGKSDTGLADSTGTNESERSEAFCKTGDPLDQLVSSEEGPRRRWW